jgi:hypothetical protein
MITMVPIGGRLAVVEGTEDPEGAFTLVNLFSSMLLPG